MPKSSWPGESGSPDAIRDDLKIPGLHPVAEVIEKSVSAA